MRSHKLVASAAVALLSLPAAGCDAASTNNANTAVVNANANTGANANAAADENRPLNADITREEYERDRGYYEREARRLGRTVGSGANDLWLWTKTRASLAAADDLRDSTLNVDVENDVVTLTGTVGSEQQKTRAGEIARRVDGVRDVSNNLTVSAAGGANDNR